MQDTFALDLELTNLIVNAVLALIATVIMVLSFKTSRRVSVVEHKIMEAEFTWKHLERIRKELAIKLRINHELQLWIKGFEVTDTHPWYDDIERLVKELKPFTDEYGHILPEIIALYNKLDLGVIDQTYTNQTSALELANTVLRISDNLVRDIISLEGRLERIRTGE